MAILNVMTFNSPARSLCYPFVGADVVEEISICGALMIFMIEDNLVVIPKAGGLLSEPDCEYNEKET